MKKTFIKKISALSLAVILILTGSMLSPYSSASSSVEENEKTLESRIDSIASVEDSALSADKEETVYIISGADGSPEQTIVTEWLRNPDKAAAITDYTELQDIENTNGYETFTLSGNALTWDADGSDIHYSGTTDKKLPVTVKITYYLDGIETAPEDMAGRSGHVAIRFDYTNNTKMAMAINGEKADICVPFLMASGLILDGDSFSNVTVSTGTVYNDGSKNIVIGCALPGLAESLGLKDGDYNIPEYVEMEADTTDFSLSMTLTIAINGLLNNLTVGSASGLADLNGDLADLGEAAKQLVDGTSDLADGAEKLSEGLGSISANSASLTGGAYTVFKSLTEMAAEQLNAALTAAGYDTVSLSPSDYSTVLTGLLDKISEGAYSQATAAAEEQVRDAVTEQVKVQVKAQVTETVRVQVTKQVKVEIMQSLTAKGYSEEQAETYLQTEEGQALINTNVAQQMASDEIQQTISTYVEQQMASDEVQQTIEAYVAQQMESDDVQKQIEAAVSSALAESETYQSIAALKAQLDSYAVFYTGIKTYTAGVDSAYSGSIEISSGAEGLANGAQKFYDEGIEKLVGALDGDYGKLLDRLQVIADAGKAYQSFGGISDDMTGSVRFIWKTEGI